jgi:hypothetical protein
MLPLPLSIGPKSLLRPIIRGRKIDSHGLSWPTIYHNTREPEGNDFVPIRIPLTQNVPLTPALLRLDPMFDLLRNDPRFQKLSASPAPK